MQNSKQSRLGHLLVSKLIPRWLAVTLTFVVIERCNNFGFPSIENSSMDVFLDSDVLPTFLFLFSNIPFLVLHTFTSDDIVH